ncbi:MAG: FAD-dependent oxidoreductase [Phycisphaerales bacterium]|nr:FAD-dependent oxidoreductase [Phycisphaerales bacterium]
MPIVLNGVHSQLNRTTVHDVVTPRTVDEVVDVLDRARREGRRVSCAGGRHAMGGQQFGTDTLHLDGRRLDQIHDLDQERGMLRVGAGATWPDIIQAIRDRCGELGWAIRQNQTGADDLTIGGAVRVNIHGRGFGFGPCMASLVRRTLPECDRCRPGRGLCRPQWIPGRTRLRSTRPRDGDDHSPIR